MKNENKIRQYHQYHDIGVKEKDINDVVHKFYVKVRKDPDIGPIFESAVNDNWDEHLLKMCDFWSSVILKSGRYNGNPLAKHMSLKTIRPYHFEVWLNLFHETVFTVLDEEAAKVFFDKAQRIAAGIKFNMFPISEKSTIQINN